MHQTVSSCSILQFKSHLNSSPVLLIRAMGLIFFFILQQVGEFIKARGDESKKNISDLFPRLRKRKLRNCARIICLHFRKPLNKKKEKDSCTIIRPPDVFVSRYVRRREIIEMSNAHDGCY